MEKIYKLDMKNSKEEDLQDFHTTTTLPILMRLESEIIYRIEKLTI